MAKQLVGPIERHIEKLVLGIVGVAFLGAVAMYLATSPNKIELGGEQVGPGQIASKVLDRAEMARSSIRSARPDLDEFEPIADDFTKEVNAIEAANVDLEADIAVAWQPPVPIIDKVGKTEQDRGLVPVQPLVDLVATSGRSTFLVDDGDGNRFISADWASVGANFDIRQQIEDQRLEYGSSRKDVVFLPPDVQRRRQRPDGSWSDDDWEDIQTWPAESVPPPPQIEITKSAEGTWELVSRDMFTRTDRYITSLNAPVIQLNVLRPLMPTIVGGDPWDLPAVTSRRDILTMDQEYLYPNPNDRPDSPEDRYPGREEVAAAAGPGAPDTMSPENLLELAREYLKTAQETCDKQSAVKAYNRALTVSRDQEAGRAIQEQAKRIMVEAEFVEADINAQTCRPRVKPVTGGQGEAEVQRVPIQQFIVHDAKPSSIRNGASYQYRLRPRIINVLAAQPLRFKDPNSAKVVIIKGEWSEPSPAVTFEPDMYFYATNNDPRDNEVRIELFRWFQGYWVKTSESFTVGDRLATEERCEIILPMQQSVSKPRIPFNTDKTIVEIEHKRPHMARNKSRSGSVSYEPESDACCVVYMDEDGHLYERYVPTDKSDPGKNIVGDRVFKPTTN